MVTLAQNRDEKVLDGIIKHKYLRTDQAAELYFQSIRNPEQRKRKAATRLLSLYRKRLVQRFRFPGDPFIYTVSGTRYSPKILHYLAVTDSLIQLLPLLPSSSRVEYEIEYNLGKSIADLYLTWNNEFRGQTGELFVEVELAGQQDIVEKIRKYEDLLYDRKNVMVLVICKHKRTIDRLRGDKFIMPVQAVDMRYVREQFNLSEATSFK